jgi:hypothetical protein
MRPRHGPRLAAVLLLGTALAVAGCGRTPGFVGPGDGGPGAADRALAADARNDAPAGRDAPPADAGDASRDGGHHHDATAEDAPPDAGPQADAGPAYSGYVFVNQDSLQGYAYAAFFGPQLVPQGGPTPPAWEGNDCQVQLVRLPSCDPPCGVGWYCAADDVCAEYPPPTPFVSAGVIHVTGGSLSGAFDLVPDATAAYTALSFPSGIYLDGETLAFAAEGDVVSAFQGEVPAPRPMSTTSPDLASLDYPQGAPIQLRWAAGLASEHVTITLTGYVPAGTHWTQIFCDTADDGEHDIPGEATAFFPSPLGYRQLLIRRERSAQVVAGNVSVTLSVGAGVYADRPAP